MAQTNDTRHPGSHVRTVLRARGISVSEAARRIGVSRTTVSHVLNGRAGLTPMMAVRLEMVFAIPAEEILHMQVAYDLARAREAHASAHESGKLGG